MIRNLKALGLALVAMAAFGSLMASGAQAQTTFNAGAEEWHPTGVQLKSAEKEGRFTIKNLGHIACEEGHFDPTKTYKGSQTEVEVTPTYNKCHAIILGTTYPVTVTHNGCTYDFHVQEKLETNTYKGDVKLTCPEGVQGIEIHVFNNVVPQEHKNVRCTYTVKPQTVQNVITHNNTGVTPKDVIVTTGNTYTGSETKVKVNKTSGSLLQCLGNEFEADYDSENTVTATNTLGETVESLIEG